MRYATLQRSVALAVTFHNFEEWRSGSRRSAPPASRSTEGRLGKRAVLLCLLAAFVVMPFAIVGLVTLGSVVASSAP